MTLTENSSVEILLAKPGNILNRHITFYSSNDSKGCTRWMHLCLFKQIPSEYSLIIILWQQVIVICKSYFWSTSNFIWCELKDANQWNMFVMIIKNLNNENTVNLSIYTKSSYDDWWKLDGEGFKLSLYRQGDRSGLWKSKKDKHQY